MALNINDVSFFLDFVSNKYQSGSISPAEKNSAFAIVNLDILNQKIGLPEEYQAGYPIPRQGWQITQKMTDDLRLFVKKATITKGVNGFFAYPADYAAFSSARYRWIQNNTSGNPSVEERWIEVVTDAELNLRLNSAIQPPDLRYPVMAYYDTGMIVYPTPVNQLELTYIRYPVQPVWGFTLSPNDEPIYDPTTSVQIEYPETMYPNFAIRAARYLGINIREEDFVNYMLQRQTTGQ